MEIINDLNLKKQADDLGVRVWQTPGFLFVVMGVATIIIMAITYFIYKNYNDPQFLVIAECLVVTVIFVASVFMIRFIEQMLKLNKMKSEFVSVASHQLRTPLSAIKWETELLLGKFKEGLNERQVDKIKNIYSLNLKMLKLVSDLLNVARIDQNSLIIIKREFDFSEIAQECVKELVLIGNFRNIKTSIEIEKNLPKAFGDPEKVKMVIENLVENAIKYTTGGGKVEIRIFSQNKSIIFEVRDNGVGIPKEQFKRVFERFFRSDNAARYQTEGTGLGLYIAKNTVEQMNGKIWFQSIENIGSSFSFSIPMAKNDKKSE